MTEVATDSSGAMPAPVDAATAVAAAVIMSVVGTNAFLLLPQLIEAVVSDLHFSDQRIGYFSALMMAGSTVSAFASTLWVRRICENAIAFRLFSHCLGGDHPSC